MSKTLEWRKAKSKELRGLERRTFSVEGMEIREADDGTLNLTGYASVTGVPYEVGWYVETIEPGAFKRTLGESPDVQLLINHTGLPLARTRSGTLRLEERTAADANGMQGLWVDADLDPEDPDVISLRRKMLRGDIDQMSFAFLPTSDAWNEDFTARSVKACSIHRGDVSVVNQGANPATLASIRSADAVRALTDLGGRGVLAAFREWRDWTLVPLEQRAGKTLSSATMEVLSQVLSLAAAADEALDEAQPLLADLMGVPNPDTDDGEADTVERSITSEKTLCAAIRAVVREPGKDERRAEIIERARELTLGGLVPDAWNEDGTLRALDGQEQRETWGDIYTALEGALDDALVTGGDYYYVWVRDFTDAEVIYSAGGDLYSAPYTLVPGGECTVDVGAATKVRPVTEYVGRSNEPEAVETRAPTPLPDSTIRARQVLRMREIRGAR